MRPSIRTLEPTARPSSASAVSVILDPIIIADDFSMCADSFLKSSK
jgi:hypothetical protein